MVIEETTVTAAAETHAEAPVTESDNIDSTTSTSAETSADSGLVNINTASLEELESLYGIGEKLAAAIAEYRQEQPFETIEDIMKVKGIGEKKFENIKDMITC
ncbi:MAG: helix-hairpin-helix domain-containing protein [Ruminococcus sp.]|nr:helix-hairpin-helix domain-containing protein [Ruminococcus sp.]